jgi:hypothetical protein
MPSGSISGQTGVSYTYFTSSTDTDGDDIKYIFNWGDGNISETDWQDSGTTGSKSHSWNTPGIYFVMARAIDRGNASSDWSDAREISITTSTYILTSTIIPPGTGTITPNEGSFESGTIVEINAENVTMTSDKNIIAYFAIPGLSEPALEWSKTFGGVNDDGGRSIQHAKDGGYIICGYTHSYGAGFEDIYLIKTDSYGNTTWIQAYGGPKDDSGAQAEPTLDGGYIIVGETQSFGSGTSDIWLIKTSPNGMKSWDSTLGGMIPEWGKSVQQTKDGGYIITGIVTIAGPEIWLIKTDPLGNQLWYSTFNGESDEAVSSVLQTADGGYIIVSDKRSFKTGVDIWLIKTDSNGNKIWERTFGGNDYDYAHSVQQTADGGYIISGETKSYGTGNADVWLVKTDSAGYKVWDQTFGGEQRDSGLSVQQITDGGYIISGETESYGAGNSDVWLIITDSDGNKVWDQTFGGEQRDSGLSVKQTPDGGYIVIGETESYGAGGTDVWLLKLSAS